MFKRLKSLTAFGHLPKYDDISARAWLYGKLFVGLLTEKLIDSARVFPPGATIYHSKTKSHWREFEFMFHQIQQAVEPNIALNKVIANCGHTCSALAEASRKRSLNILQAKKITDREIKINPLT